LVNFLITTIFYGVLMFKDQVPWWGLVLIAILWLIYVVVEKRLSFDSPMELPVFLLLLLLPINFFISVDRLAALPKIYGLLLGISLFFLIVKFIRKKSHLLLAGIGLFVLALGVAFLGLFGMDWSANEVVFLSRVYERLPDLFDLISGATSFVGINPNSMGGALALFIPLLFSLLWDKCAIWDLVFTHQHRIFYLLYRLTISITLVLSILVLLLTQSVGAIIGSVISVLILLIWQDKRWIWSIPVFLLVAFIGFYIFLDANFLKLVQFFEHYAIASFANRLEIWDGAIRMIPDFTLTGAGLGSFGRLFATFYSPHDQLAFHAHNTFLTVTVDMGIPVLILYISILCGISVMAVRLTKKSPPVIRVLIMGLFGGLLAHLLFGIMDSYILGAKLGIFMWLFFGVIVSVFVHQDQMDFSTDTPGSISANTLKNPLIPQNRVLPADLLLAFGAWLFLALVSLAFVNFNVYLSLLLAVVGGIILGIMITKRHNFKAHVN